MKRRGLARINLTDPAHPKLDFVSKNAFLNDLKDFKDGQRVWVEVSTYYRQRSLAQNNVIHWYCTEISNETGMDLEEVKSLMKLKFLQRPILDKDGIERVDEETGEVMHYIPSTAELSTVEAMEFTEKIRVWCMEFLNIVLPLPEQEQELKFK